MNVTPQGYPVCPSTNSGFRQHGTFHFIGVSVFALYEGAKTETQKKIKYRIKDALFDSGQVVPAGQGDGQLHETLTALRASGFDGFFSLEPHLASAGTFSG